MIFSLFRHSVAFVTECRTAGAPAAGEGAVRRSSRAVDRALAGRLRRRKLGASRWQAVAWPCAVVVEQRPLARAALVGVADSA